MFAPSLPFPLIHCPIRPYIQIETEAIKDANDKMMISSYCLSKLEMVNWYLELLEVGSKKYIVPQSKAHLLNLNVGHQIGGNLLQLLWFVKHRAASCASDGVRELQIIHHGIPVFLTHAHIAFLSIPKYDVVVIVRLPSCRFIVFFSNCWRSAPGNTSSRSLRRTWRWSEISSWPVTRQSWP